MSRFRTRRGNRTTVKINMAQLRKWMTEALDEILYDIEHPDRGWSNDYFTATDLEACVRLIADRSANETFGAREGRFQWWGYNGWCTVKVVDKRYPRMTLLDMCRDFLLGLRGTKLEGHNFGRGHVSGMRFRRIGTGKSETEVKTITKAAKEKPVHIREPKDPNKPYYAHRELLCQVGIERKPSWRGRGRSRSIVRTTEDPTKVTCKRCLNRLQQPES